MLRFFWIIIIFLFASGLNAQRHWETIVMADDDWTYLVGDSEPPSDWYQETFDDAGWNTGRGSFGFGDNDDTTILTIPYSLYIRTSFNVVSAAGLDSLIMDIDYDDAYVAYLNGQVISRSANVGTDFPTFDYTPSAYHEATMYAGGSPERIGIPLSFLMDGENTLAIHGLNMEPTSTDFSLAPFLHIMRDGPGIIYSDVPAWFIEPDPEFESNLPIMIIDTEGGASIPDEPKITASMGIIYNGPGERNYINDTPNEYNGKIGIEMRGNSTMSFPKKPYNFETRDDLGENLNVSLLGMPAENDWVLRASYLDHTFIRNALADQMSRLTGRWASRTRHVELFLNGEYRGIYVFMESLKRDNNRLDIARLDSNEISGEDVTGGYIWEITGFGDDFGESRKLKYPDIADIQPEQLNYIRSVDNAFRNKMRAGSDIYANPDTGYVAHINVESFLYEAIVQEAIRNSDAYGWSGYYHKDKNGLINAGPVWDFDQSAGNSSYPDDGVVDLWMMEHPSTSNTPFYWPLLLHDPFFYYSLSLRWKELRAGPYSNENLLAYVDSIAGLLGEAQAREFEKWPVLGKYIWRETSGYEQRDSYNREVGYLKSFLTQRWTWIDNQLADVTRPAGYPDISILNYVDDMEVYLTEKKIYLDLNKIFSYPYVPDLKFDALSSDTSIVLPDVKKSDSLKLELHALGQVDITLQAKDIYGNKKKLNFNMQVIEFIDTTTVVNRITTGKMLLYPNPATDRVEIKVENFSHESIEIDLFNMVGQQVDQIYSGPAIDAVEFGCEELKNGVYMVILRSAGTRVQAVKLVINR